MPHPFELLRPEYGVVGAERGAPSAASTTNGERTTRVETQNEFVTRSLERIEKKIDSRQ